MEYGVPLSIVQVAQIISRREPDETLAEYSHKAATLLLTYAVVTLYKHAMIYSAFPDVIKTDRLITILNAIRKTRTLLFVNIKNYIAEVCAGENGNWEEVAWELSQTKFFTQLASAFDAMESALNVAISRREAGETNTIGVLEEGMDRVAEIAKTLTLELAAEALKQVKCVET